MSEKTDVKDDKFAVKIQDDMNPRELLEWDLAYLVTKERALTYYIDHARDSIKYSHELREAGDEVNADDEIRFALNWLDRADAFIQMTHEYTVEDNDELKAGELRMVTRNNSPSWICKRIQIGQA